MRVLRSPDEVGALPRGPVRALVERRMAEVGGAAGFEVRVAEGHGVEPGDPAPLIEAELGLPLLTGLLDPVPFGDPDFAPAWEWAVDHGDLYELVFVLTDEGFGVEVLIPVAPGVDADLLALCAALVGPEAEAAA